MLSSVMLGILLSLLTLLTVGGNVLVCLAVCASRRLRCLTNCFIVSLAVTDLLLGLLVLPFSAMLQLNEEWPLGPVFCNFYISMDVMLCTASILTLLAISVDRYLAVTMPLRYASLVLPWRVAVAMLQLHCRNNPSTSTTVVSTVTAVALREHKATVTLAAVIGAFVVCWLPYFILFTVLGLKEHPDPSTVPAFPIVLWLGYANSALNPILYGALNRDFSSVHMEESSVMQGAQGVLVQNWPTASSAADAEGGEVSPPMGAGVDSNSWHFRYGPGGPGAPPQHLKPGEVPQKPSSSLAPLP
ncbi:Histamine H2 receptor [Larimichthys crocea]|uniref:Histamine H2 receptor n=1 Tax=Larimichthys crocea TaxID=215358 RepID=A0A6G0I3D8_LARCR|nr:Histamine H2 receptor [Larimichthys crocea]